MAGNFYPSLFSFDGSIARMEIELQIGLSTEYTLAQGYTCITRTEYERDVFAQKV